jgi:hypothetical protein
MQCSFIENKTFLVSNYGAYPNDGLDDANAIQLAINEAIKYGSVSDVVFGYGTYDISSIITILDAENLTITGQGIDKTFIIGHDSIGIFVALFSQGVKITSFSIDFDPLPFTAGYVVDVNEKYLDVQVVPPHQTDVGRQVMAILRYDPVKMRPAFGSQTYEIYQHPFPNDTNTTIVSPGVLRLPLVKATQFQKGDPIVARYIATRNCLDAQFVTDITIESVTIYTSWCMGFLNLGVRRATIKDYHVIPRNGRWMSSIIDCIHFSDAREFVSITDSTCQAMGDDGLNVHAVLFLVTSVINATTIIIDSVTGSGPIDLGIGTHLEFSSSQQPFTVYGNGTVASIKYNSGNTRLITFTNPVNISINDWVCVGDTPILTIRNFTVSHNRARGVLLETRNIDIRQSVFNRTSGPAVLIQPSLFWHEGPEARNVTLSENLYIENNEGIAQEKAVISILPFPVQSVAVINDIRIESSTFYLGNYSKDFLQSDNANNIFITGNYIAINRSSPIISICNSRNISAENNCVRNDESQIDQYYSFDENKPCSINSSNLINLPLSAFNSSFPPPV